MRTASAVTLLVLRCADVERSRAFYEALGLTMRAEQHGGGPRHYSSRVGETILELYPRGEIETRGLRFGLRVGDVAGVLVSAARHGGKVLRVAADTGPAALLEDLDGHKIELLQCGSPPVCSVDTSRIVDWESFHSVFAATLGFPSFYGRNMDAWIDCMTSLDAPEHGLTTLHVERGQVLTLALEGTNEFSERCPEIYQALIDCAAFVNWRRFETGDPPVLTLSFYRARSSISQ
jgi:catechol 2,3-dioxygenase-like lactoylglutathione lyase family enzyme